MSYTYYCFGLAAQAVDSELTEEDVVRAVIHKRHDTFLF
jgi:hypothetical protein